MLPTTTASGLIYYCVACMIVPPGQSGKLDNSNDVDIWRYTREDLLTLGNKVWDLTVSPHTDNIYIAYGQHGLMVLEKGHNEMKNLIHLDGWTLSVAVDRTVPKVYLGKNKKLQIYDETTKITTDVQELPFGAWKLFHGRNFEELYLSKTDDRDIYKYQDNFADHSYFNVDIEDWDEYRYVVDDEGNVYYTTKEDGSDVTKIVKANRNSVTYDDGPFYALAVDNSGNVFGTSHADHGVYHLKADGSKPRLVASLDFTPWLMSFDRKNNVVFVTEARKVIVLRMNNENDVTYNCNQNLTAALHDINNKLNVITLQNMNMFDSMMTLIQSMEARFDAIETRLKLQTDNEEQSDEYNFSSTDLDNSINIIQQQ